MKQIIVDNQATTYYITEDGQCYNGKTGRWLSGQVSNSGYLNYYITLANGVKRRLYAHRLVAMAYIPNDDPEHKKEVNHIDLDKMNNKADNLEWVTASCNQRYNVLHGNKSSAVKVFQFDKDKNLIREYICIEDIERAGYTKSLVQQELYKEVKELTLNSYWNISSDNNFRTLKRPNTGKAKTVLQYDKQGNFIAEYGSTGEAIRSLGLTNPSHIGECCRGKIKSYKGYVWKYKE